MFLNCLFRIEAAIVRIMKARKKLSHNLLVTEVSTPIIMELLSSILLPIFVILSLLVCTTIKEPI